MADASITSKVVDFLKKSDAWKALSTFRPFAHVEGLEGYPLSLLIRSLVRIHKGRVWVVCPTEDSALMMLKDFGCKVNGRVVEDLPRGEFPLIYLPASSRMVYTDGDDDASTYEQVQRLGEIELHAHSLVVTHLRSFVLPVPTRESIRSATLTFHKGDPFQPEQFSKQLAASGYARSPSTTSPGEFTIRGEVMDLFPFEGKEPYRIFADWEEVGRIASFDPLTQQTVKDVDSLRIPLLMGERRHYGKITSYFQKEDFFVLVGDQRLSTSFRSLMVEAKAGYREAYQRDSTSPNPKELLFDFPSFLQTQQNTLLVNDLKGQDEKAYSFDIDGSRSYFGSFVLLRQDLKALKDDGWDISIFSGNRTQRERLGQMLSAYPDIRYVQQEISGGFSIQKLKVIALCEHEIFGRRRQVIKTLERTQSSPLDSFVDLHEGDYVVHVNYGIGRFLKIDRVKSFDRERDYIKIEYAGGEFLYVPIEQANLVQRYIGSEGGSPKLDKIGGSGWEHKKAKAHKSAEALAGHLIGLYAKRKNSVGFAFQKDNDMQLQFEASFPYDETPDQLTCIEEIKADMESPHVMDRLVCGDVGYGKTEIAFRAAFKAVLSGKQVAFLAPTTILAQQHYRNFLKRVGDFPVNAGLLSRIVSPKEQKETLVKVASGSVDVLFGTHRILQKDILFKDLGLLVVDEEQRFGVKDKEKIKAMRASIDSLTLSATPIPRTLYMSLLSIRDMSLLTTAPMARRPIKTTITEYDEGTVVEAIVKEVERGGQVFYLHNRIETLDAVVASLRSALPSLIIESAHGQMESEELDERMYRFINQGIQVLVSTTIIENGIDIPNVNTIIIDRADQYGVSQLYQLRGRVGRSDQQAYAFLFYPSDAMLSELAVKRLKVISEHTELGSGFKVSMKDMEIRGTGNLLGREQSGQVASVGLDMYIKILDDAVRELQKKGETPEQREVFLELDYSGFIPDSYITVPSVKFDIYRRIALVRTEEELDRLTGELADKYGHPPVEVDNLLYIAEIKILCRKLSVIHLIERQGLVTLEFAHVADVNPTRVINLIAQSGGSVKYDFNNPSKANFLYMKTSAVSLKDKALFIMEKLQRLL